MQVCREVSEIRHIVSGFKAAGKTVGLVPTMGALHAGHVALINAARARCDHVVATLFVNPSQFGDASDLKSYPRSEADDLSIFRASGVDAVFAPEVSTMYVQGDETIVETTRLGNILHGAVRPGHFRGVTTVVARLFNICTPTHAFFGEKDYQQLQVIRRMVLDLHFPVDIVGVPTVREPDGLAMSSRNARLTPKDRAASTVIKRALDRAENLYSGHRDIASMDRAIRETIAQEPRATLRGLDIVSAQDLQPVSGPITRPVAIMISVEFSGILLIDQKEITP